MVGDNFDTCMKSVCLARIYPPRGSSGGPPPSEEILSQFVAKEVNVLKVDVPRAGGKGWKRTNSEIETQDTDLGNRWCEEVSTGAKYVLEETWVKANDPHYDAKVWPIAHPYGTSSERSEVGSGSPAAHARNRATLIQSWFRRTARWAF